MSDKIEKLEFENELFRLVALITNFNFRLSFQYLDHDFFFLQKDFFSKKIKKKKTFPKAFNFCRICFFILAKKLRKLYQFSVSFLKKP